MAKNEVNEELKPIVLRYGESEEYTLDFDRESVKFAEARGFDINNVAAHPMTEIPNLFFYAFRKNHKSVSREKTDRILFDDLGGMPEGMLERLALLYTAPFEALTQNGEKSKNPKVTVEM